MREPCTGLTHLNFRLKGEEIGAFGSAGVLACEYWHRLDASNEGRLNVAQLSGGETPPTLAAGKVALHLNA